MTTVYTTAGGRRFHADHECRALESAQALSEAARGLSGTTTTSSRRLRAS
jgi:hypothetical protein